MKRIIDGVTYNTLTSIHLASSEYEAEYNHKEQLCQGSLWQTRGGAFFVTEMFDLGYDPDLQLNDIRHRFKALSASEAHEWLMTGEVDVHLNPFGEDPPEATAEQEASSTLYVRVPLSLKQRVDQVAKANGMSANAWVMRCVERCLARPL